MVHGSKEGDLKPMRKPTPHPTILILNARLERTVRILECPQCHGIDLYYEAGLITGYKYHCKTCNYVGAFVIERQVEVPDR